MCERAREACLSVYIDFPSSLYASSKVIAKLSCAELSSHIKSLRIVAVPFSFRSKLLLV